MAQAQDTHINMAQTSPEEQAALNEVMQLLEVIPDTVTPTNDIPAKREKLAILLSTGKSKEAIGVQLTHEQVKRLSDKEVEKYNKRQEAYIGSKTTESLIDSFLMLASKGLGMVVKVDDVEKLQQDLKNDYIINQELSSLAGGLALRCGRWLALANAALITTNTSNLNQTTHKPPHKPPHTPAETVNAIHSRALMKFANLAGIWEESDRNLEGIW